MRLFGISRDRAAEFELAATRHMDEFVRVATAACGSHDIAEDMVQETYMRAWKYWDSFEQGTNCRAWLYKILFNVIRTRRGGKDPSTVPLDEIELATVLPFAPAPAITVASVKQALERLPDDFRIPLLLVAVEGYSYKEAAQILEVPIGTIMSRLHRGREALHRLIDNEPRNSNSKHSARNAV